MRNQVMLTLCTGLLLVAAVTTGARADSWRGPLQGGLIGGAVGALIGQSSEIDSRVAIPALAVTGALIGYGHERGWYNRSRSDRYYIEYGWPYYTYGYSRHAYPYGYNRHAYPYTDDFGYHRPTRQRTVIVSEAAHGRPSRQPARRDARHPPVERHPGVAVEQVAVALSNGVTVNVRLVKLHDRYVGPRGDSYAERPSALTLRRQLEGRD